MEVIKTWWCQDILKSICKSGESDTPPYRADTHTNLQTGGGGGRWSEAHRKREIWRYGDIIIINEDHCSLLSSLLPKICLSAEEKRR